MNNKSYIFSLDVIRVLAIIGVVVIHIANAVYTRPDFFGGTMWWITIVLDSLSRISIPLFLLISGYLILRKDEQFQDNLKRILFRIGIPFIFWLLFYLWYGGGFPNFIRVNWSIFQKIFFVDVYHLYYLVILMGLYFIAPFIRSYIKTASEKIQISLTKALLVLGMGEIALQFIFRSCTNENFFTRWIPYAGFFVGGYVLGNRIGKYNKYGLFMGYAVALITTIAFNYVNAFLVLHNNTLLMATGCLSHYTDHYLSINVVVMALCAFLLLLPLKFQFMQSQMWISNLVKSIARASFGIYLLHPVVARFLEVQFHLAIDFSPLPIAAIIGLRLVLVFGISYLLTVVIRHIPVVKIIVGER